MIKLYIVDDHVLIREGVKDFFDEAEDISIIGEAGTGEQMLEDPRIFDADMIVLDVSMPGKGGKETMMELKQKIPEKPVVFFSVHHDKNIANELMDLGAAGYITKDTKPEEIIDVIRRINNGEKYISPTTSFDFDF